MSHELTSFCHDIIIAYLLTTCTNCTWTLRHCLLKPGAHFRMCLPTYLPSWSTLSFADCLYGQFRLVTDWEVPWMGLVFINHTLHTHLGMSADTSRTHVRSVERQVCETKKICLQTNPIVCTKLYFCFLSLFVSRIHTYWCIVWEHNIPELTIFSKSYDIVFLSCIFLMRIWVGIIMVWASSFRCDIASLRNG